MRILLVDNYDSFTYNVADQLARLGCEVIVRRNDSATVADLIALDCHGIVLSPGPGRPEDAGVSPEIVRVAVRDGLPLLGICLGMQCIGFAHGARITRLDQVLHGEASDVTHDGAGVFATAPQPLAAGRYHSLVVDDETLPAELIVTARTADGVLMGIRHVTAPVEGVQFHPESVLTPDGDHVLAAFLQLVARTHELSAPTPITSEVA